MDFKDEFDYVKSDQSRDYEQYTEELSRVAYNDISDYNARVTTMVVSENQRLLNNIVSDKITYADQIVRKVIPKLLVNKIANVHPMLRPTSQIFLKDEARNIIGHSIYSKTRNLKTRITKEMSVDEISNSLVKEINEETLKDLHLELVSTARVSCHNDADEQELIKALGEIQEQLIDSRFIVPYLVMNESVYEKYEDFFTRYTKTALMKYTVINNCQYNIEVVKDSPYDDILVVCKDYTPLTGSYFFCPYVLLVHLEGDKYCTRYDKKYIPPAKGKKSMFGLIKFDKDRESTYNI